MSGGVFVDTNILVYAHDQDAGVKGERARAALDRLWQSRTGCLSVQVLQEFLAITTGKLKAAVTPASAREVVRVYAAWVKVPTSPDIVLRASEIAESTRLSVWAGLIVAAAEACGAAELYSEDLNEGQVIAGIRVVNPLKQEGAVPDAPG